MPTNPDLSAQFATQPISLEDPIREVSDRTAKFLLVLFLLLIALSLFIGVSTLLMENTALRVLMVGGAYYCWMMFFSCIINLVWWRAFAPRRVTDLFYLRSFRNDPISWPIRVAIQDAVGDRFRLSGIRDPRRRIDVWGDGLAPWLKSMRNSTPKFMDLEAGEDWKARLWNSLQSGRCAIIDLSDVTSIVLEEIKLVTAAIGIERVIFIGTSPSQSSVELRELIGKQLLDIAPQKFNLLMWKSGQDPKIAALEKRKFKEKLLAIFHRINQLPAINKTEVPKEFSSSINLTDKIPKSKKMVRWMLLFQAILMGIQISLWLFGMLISRDANIQTAVIWLGSLPAMLLNLVFFIWNFAVYFRDVGILRRRLKATILIGLQLYFLFPLIALYFFPGPKLELRTAPSQQEIADDQMLLEKEVTNLSFLDLGN